MGSTSTYTVTVDDERQVVTITKHHGGGDLMMLNTKVTVFGDDRSLTAAASFSISVNQPFMFISYNVADKLVGSGVAVARVLNDGRPRGFETLDRTLMHFYNLWLTEICATIGL